MADIVPTAATVIASSSANVVSGKAGASLTAGQFVYRASATGLFHLADADAAGETRQPVGITLNTAAVGQAVAVATSGDITMTTVAAMTPGSFYYLSSNPGGIAPVADLGATEQVIQLGFARTATSFALQIVNTAVVL